MPQEMMKVQEPPKRATVSATRWAKRGFLLDDLVGIAAGPAAHQLLGGMKLAAEGGHHVHAGHRFAKQQRFDGGAVHFQAGGLFDGVRAGAVMDLLDHGRKTEKLAVPRLVHDDLLVVLVKRGHAHRTGQHHIGAVGSFVDFVDALPGGKLSELDEGGKQVELLIVQQGKERHMSQLVFLARHDSTSIAIVASDSSKNSAD